VFILSFQVLTGNFADCKGTVYFDASLAPECLPDLKYRLLLSKSSRIVRRSRRVLLPEPASLKNL